MLSHGLLAVLGMLLVVCGFWGGHRCRKPYNTLAAWCAPVGLIVVLASTVLFFIPHFFA